MKAKRLLALCLSCCVCGLTSTAFAAQPAADTEIFHNVFDAATVTQYSSFTGKNYILPAGYHIYDGIDVSSKNRTINWNAVAKDGVDFALIQVGQRGVKSGELFEEETYTTYVNGAAAVDLPVGVVFSSQAVNTSEAEEEAQFVLSHVKRDNIQLPIAMNYAYYDGSGRLEQANLSQSQKTANVLAFCDTIRNAGYVPMLCASREFLSSEVYTDQIQDAGVKIWLTHYTTQTNYTEYDCWQYTGSGSVDGISNDTACNFYLTDGDLIPKHTVCGFQDVLSTDWFAPAVQFVFQNKLMNGTSSTRFEPNLSLTRGMVAQVLYNFSGRPAVTQPPAFSDVSADQWYANAVAWAQQNGIMNGFPNNTFGANDSITRQDFAAVLYRYSNKQQLDTSARANLRQYQDASSVSSYAQDAMQWAVASKVISGKSSTQLAPRDSATRAECAQMLKNYLTGVASSLLGS